MSSFNGESVATKGALGISLLSSGTVATKVASETDSALLQGASLLFAYGCALGTTRLVYKPIETGYEYINRGIDWISDRFSS